MTRLIVNQSTGPDIVPYFTQLDIPGEARVCAQNPENCIRCEGFKRFRKYLCQIKLRNKFKTKLK